MKSLHLFLLLCVSLLLVAMDCNEDTAPTTAGSGDVIMHLKAGSYSVYRNEDLDTLGNIISVDTVTFAILRDTTINAEKWALMNTQELLTNRSTGLWYAFGSESGTLAIAGLIAKFPGKAGDTWYGPDSLLCTIAATNATITVPHGNYACYRYTYIDPVFETMDVVRYFTVNKGLILDEFYDLTASGREYVAQRRVLIGTLLTKPSGYPVYSVDRMFSSRR